MHELSLSGESQHNDIETGTEDAIGESEAGSDEESNNGSESDKEDDAVAVKQEEEDQNRDDDRVNKRRRLLESHESLVNNESSQADNADVQSAENKPTTNSAKQLISSSSRPLTEAELVFNARSEVRPDLKGYQLYAWQYKVHHLPLSSLLHSANKAVTGKDWLLAREEAKQMKILTRIDQLKSEGKWSFKQLKRSETAPREKTHWDFLLEEMKWMREDYKQEKRWKKANAKLFADMAVDWIKGPNAGFPRRSASEHFVPIGLSDIDRDPEDTLQSREDQSVPLDLATSPENEILELPKSHAKIRAKVPVYDPEELEMMTEDIIFLPPHPDDTSKYLSDIESYSIVPVTKLMSQKHVARQFIIGDEYSRSVQALSSSKVDLENIGSALFGNTRPSKYPEPTCPQPPHKSPFAWTAEEDQFLERFIEEFKGNWEIISESMQSIPGTNTGTRSPWDCFWRYQQLQEREAGISGLKTKNDVRKRKDKHFTMFEMINKCVIDREEARRQEVPDRQKKSDLGQDPYKAAQLNPDQRPPTPMELSAMKQQKDKADRQADEMQRHNQLMRGIAQHQAMMMGRPPMVIPGPQNQPNMPPGPLPMQLPFAHFRPTNSTPGMFNPRPPAGPNGTNTTPNNPIGLNSNGRPNGQNGQFPNLTRSNSATTATSAAPNASTQPPNGLPGASNQFTEQMKLLMRNQYLSRSGTALPFNTPPNMPQFHNVSSGLLPGHMMPPAFAAAYRQNPSAAGNKQQSPPSGQPPTQNLSPQDAAKFQMMARQFPQQMMMFNPLLGQPPGLPQMPLLNPQQQPPTSQSEN